jgi:hypothetical protein
MPPFTSSVVPVIQFEDGEQLPPFHRKADPKKE